MSTYTKIFTGSISTLALLKDAVIAGELDDAIANASDKLRAGFGK